MTDELSRVSMLWPTELKAKVQEEVGSRGLTEFTLTAVQAAFDGGLADRDLQRQIGEARFVAQVFADAFATRGSRSFEEMIQEVYVEIGDLPAWIESTGWPTPNVRQNQNLATAPKSDPQDSHTAPTTAPTAKQEEPEEQPEPVAPVTEVPAKKVDEVTPELTPEDRARVDESKSGLLSRILDRTGDTSPFQDMKVATEIPKPAPKEAEEEPVEEPVEEESVEESADADFDLGEEKVCPKCGDHMLGGICWSC